MSAAPAPFHADVAEAPAGAAAWFIRAGDGVRLRVGRLGTGEAGTVLLVPGRTEYLEKYGRAAADFAARGFGLAALDYRGQGLADRLLDDPAIGHVATFRDYQRDIDAFFGWAEAQSLPRPWFLLGHSLGGAIALRALLRGAPVRAAAFSAPMWGIAMAEPLRPLSWGLGWLAHRNGLDGLLTPGTGKVGYVRACDPDDNFLTTAPEMLAYMRRHLAAEPRLDLGGPSLPWLYRALAEARALRRATPTAVPTLTFLPGDERIVSPRAIRQTVARWPRARLVEVPGGRHETMMETPERRRMFFDTTSAFFREHAVSDAGGVDRIA